MALTQWKNFDDFFADPWRHHREMLTSSKLYHPWTGESAFKLQPFEFPPISWDFKEFEQRVQEMQERFHKEIAGVVPSAGKDGFEVCVDVHEFTPSEITVKINGSSVIIEGKHEEKQDQRGYISRQFTKRYDLPSGYDANMITSELSSDGFLTVKAPFPKQITQPERIISIKQTGEKRAPLVST